MSKSLWRWHGFRISHFSLNDDNYLFFMVVCHLFFFELEIRHFVRFHKLEVVYMFGTVSGLLASVKYKS